MGLNRGDVMNFKEWLTSEEAKTLFLKAQNNDVDSAVNYMREAWNAAIEEAIKAAEDAGAFYSTIKSIKELKE